MRKPLAPTLALLALLAAQPAHATVERARAAEARGDLRTAQIELRNAARSTPNDGAVRAALAQISLDLGDADTADREARAALAGGYDRAEATALRIRAQLALGRTRDLLREFPVPDASVPRDVAAQIYAGRALAHLALEQRAEAKAAAEAAVEANPRAVEGHLALSAVAQVQGDEALAERASDAALAANGRSVQALLRRAGLAYAKGDVQLAGELLGRAVDVAPGHPLARVQRAEVRLRLNDIEGARSDAEVSLRNAPGLASAHYVQALIFVATQDWRAADTALTRLGQATLQNTSDGLLAFATVKAQLGQDAQAEEAAARAVARRPLDVRGVRLLASLQAKRGANRDATATLASYAQRGGRDPETLARLSAIQLSEGRRREAEQSLRAAVEAQPGNAELQSRLAAVRLSLGDYAGMAEAAQAALAGGRDDPAARQMLALAAISRGEAEAAEAELSRLTPEQRNSEVALLAEGSIRAMRLDLAGARQVLENALKANPASIGAKLGLARIAGSENRIADLARYLGEVLAADPENAQAATLLLRAARPGNEALAALRTAQQANPGSPIIAGSTARALLSTGDPAAASAVLEHEALRPRITAPALRLLQAEAHAARGAWADAETVARAAIAEQPTNASARRQLALVLARRDENREAEAVIEEGLRLVPNDSLLLSTAVMLAQRSGGPDAALALADRLARRPGAMPAGAWLRGDFLMALNRQAEAARAFATAYSEGPTEALALRLAVAHLGAGQPEEARRALQAWLDRSPESPAVLATSARLDLQANRTAEAERKFETLLRLSPNDGGVLNDLAWVLAQRGDRESLARARPMAERAFALAPRPETGDTLGLILLRSGEARRAVEVMRHAYPEGNAPSPGMAVRYATALAEIGEREEARRQLTAALRTPAFPERAEGERLLSRLNGSR
ncbi:XrtA/PEP-CTERM system TPR-repeat protein PrsT [Sabulicella glaciei]|uniref:PEP-CTERM system TPR-repeat protein PrsT n=1 Tax=Sabulicella glaciei TaxID=2984948 RepID=A0ABT3NSF7_9PROT|nr:XrtA/PEP-CTERM system TPR-repeat protein PrsT [Roseococcus sp. MDT2-1-1]MCW8084803.1 PEP-CTERM system TPR-repeat protein PrsT [Roseococcus sp. MDT2-1-1]